MPRTRKRVRPPKSLTVYCGLPLSHEHDKDGYCVRTPLSELRTQLSGRFEKAGHLIVELVEARAIARVAEPIRVIRDKYNRATYELSLDDGTETRARFSHPLTLGTAAWSWMQANIRTRASSTLAVSGSNHAG